MSTRAIPGIVVIVLLAGALTYGSKVAVAELTKPKAVVVKTVTVTKEEPAEEPASATTDTSTTASQSATTTTPAPAPAPASTAKTATTNSFVYLRPTAGTSGAPLQDLQAGTKVEYETVTPGLWQKVTVNGVSGYVYKKWLTY